MTDHRLPDFLVIGAMKAGTTSLCRDLEAHPNVFFPTVKEPHTLCLDSVLQPEGEKKYAALFRNARQDQICGEGSTGYTKLPSHKGVPARARAVLRNGVKLVYIVREPVARALSHHYHAFRGGSAPRDFANALRANPSMVAISRYAMQLEPWIDAFGLDQIHVVRFEDYVANRTTTVQDIYQFLGVSSDFDPVSGSVIHNAGEESLVPPPGIRQWTRRLTHSQWYKRVVHPRTPVWLRERMKSAVYRPAPERPDPPSLEVVDVYLAAVRDDADRLGRLLNRGPLWDFEQVRSRFQPAS